MQLQILSLIIALAAVLVGPYISYRIAKKNLSFQFRSLTKEKWIEKLETEIVNYLFAITQWIEKYPALKEKGQKEINLDKINEINHEIDLMQDAIITSIIKLDLFLDKRIQLQKTILTSVVGMKEIVNSKIYDKDTKAKLMLLYEIIVENSKIIFQEERKKTEKIFT